jgi:hypothetical protein
MAKKKERAFFICPRWKEVTDAPSMGRGRPPHIHGRILAAIEAGSPVARSTLRKALVAVRQASGSMFDADAYIVDQRTASR